MVIIGTTPAGFLVTMTADEFAFCGGYGSQTDVPGYKNGTGIPIGTAVNVESSYRYISELRSKQDQARVVATGLRELGDMITTGLPDTAIPPTKA